MFRHLTVAALRNILANRLQSAIAIVGLSIGISAALLMSLIVRNQTSYDHFIPGHERTYLVAMERSVAGRPPTFNDNTNRNIAGLIKLNVAGVESVTRLMLKPFGPSDTQLVELRRGDIAANETIYWAEPNAFDVLPMTAIFGDAATALRRPDGVALPLATARKFFGRDNVVGQTLLLNGHPMTVRAVIADLPSNGTELKSGIFASSLAPFSAFSLDLPDRPGNFSVSVNTYLRLKPGVSPEGVEKKMASLLAPLLPPTFAGTSISNPLLRLDQIPLSEGFHPGARTKLTIGTLVAALILFIASVNFVNLLTARAARRGLDVGIRKVCGAARIFLIAQFLGESLLTVFFAACVALALSEWLLPTVNAFLDTAAAFDYLRYPLLPVAMTAGIVVLGLAAGAYPAFVLSSFRPASVLKGILHYSPAAVRVRNGLVVLQFSILIALLVVAAVMYQQRVYATRDGLGPVSIDRILTLENGCKPAFRTEVRKLPGVAGISCTGGEFLNGDYDTGVTYKNAEMIVNVSRQDISTFVLYGIKPLVGALRATTANGDFDPDAAPEIILNQAALRKFGFTSPQAAIGQSLPVRVRLPARRPQPGEPLPPVPMVQITAVIPDVSFLPVTDAVKPTIYYPAPLGARAVSHIKLTGQNVPETLAAIDHAWAATNPGVTIKRGFVSDHMDDLYREMTRDTQMFAGFSGIAIFLACLGLFGLSVATAERRTKEIGIRKAMGARSGDVTRMLLWQFTKPVLWANLIAWPVSYYFLNNWLNGFAYHITLNPLVFVGATVLAILVALLTVAIQSTLVARAVPATALRYE